MAIQQLLVLLNYFLDTSLLFSVPLNIQESQIKSFLLLINELILGRGFDDDKKSELLTVKVLPKKLDEEVAELMVQGFGGTITKLTSDQAEYINVPMDGPFKEEEYKY